MNSSRQVASYAVLSVFLIFILFNGFTDYLRKMYSSGTESGRGLANPYQNHKDADLTVPDVSRYVHVRRLTRDEFPLDDPKRRVIIVGDIHGMIDPLEKLLKRVKYSPRKDVLIHVGDIASKAPLSGSLAVLNFMSSHNVIGVRGNHDQTIVEWRGWLDWASSISELKEWVDRLEYRWAQAHRKNPHLDLETWLQKQRKSSSRRETSWWKLIPEDWVIFSDHYKIAKDMSEDNYHYLLNLPLRLYIPTAHSFIVHGGLLPSNPEYPRDDKARQPLAAMPTIPQPQRPNSTAASFEEELLEDPDDLTPESSSPKTIEHLRNLQEIAILTKIPQNRDPWAVLNMRSIVDGEVSKKANKGTPWPKIWKEHMEHCVGFRNELEDDGSDVDDGAEEQKLKLKCYPSSIVYGHTASRGLDIRRWSFGLDTGCIYGRRLTALVIQGRATRSDDALELDTDDLFGDDFKDTFDDEDNDDVDYDARPISSMKETLPFGDRNIANLLSVKCKI